MNSYIFTSERLGFRNWNSSDIDKLFEINSNDDVMRYFPFKPSLKDTEVFIHRMQKMYEEERFCYFAVDLLLETKEFIGFIGLSKQTYKADFNPSIDIGWRLHPKFWGKGFATEGAKACLYYAFYKLKIKEILSVAPKLNVPSIKVMEKLGMNRVKEFKHSLLKEFYELETCVLYKIKTPEK